MTDLEIMQRAKMYLDRLAQGIDPISGQEMPEDTILNQARLARSFPTFPASCSRSSTTAAPLARCKGMILHGRQKCSPA